MSDISSILSILGHEASSGTDFTPSDVRLSTSFPQFTKDTDEEHAEVEWDGKVETVPISPHFPMDQQVVAIDSTSFILGYVPDGIVGATRVSVIIKPAGRVQQKLESYGPFLTAITNQNKDEIYSNLYNVVCGSLSDFRAPDVYKMMERVRNLLERYLQIQVAKRAKDSLILLDGSLLGGTVANPASVLRDMLAEAALNNNSVAAISKSTSLTLKKSKQNILSLVEGVRGPCCVSGIREMMEQEKRKYLGDIYVARFTPAGEPFRIDIASGSPIPHSKVLEMISGLAGDYGYPEELKLAHSTCVHSALEIMELQALAIKMYGLQIKEDLRSKIFPFG